MRENVICLGKKYDIIKKIKNLGYNLVLVHSQNNDSADEHVFLLERDAQYKKFDLEKLFSKYKKKQFSGVIVPSEYYVELAPQILSYLSLKTKGLTLKQAEITRNKLLLKQTLQDLDIPTTRFAKVIDVTDFDSLARFLGMPFLIKPKKEVLARGIEIVYNKNKWEEWWNLHNKNLSEFYAEEYLTDIKEYCCDTIVADEKVLAQFPGEYTISCLESNRAHNGIGVNFPGFLPRTEIDQLKEYTKDFLEKLGLKDGYFHVEFFYTKQGWKFGEIGCRLPGGYQLPTESYIAGQDLLETYLKIMINTEPTPTQTINTEGRYFGYYLYPKKVGKIRKITTSLEYPWIVESKVHVKEGQFLEDEDSSVTMAAHIVYKANSLEDLKKYSDYAKDLIKIEYED